MSANSAQRSRTAACRFIELAALEQRLTHLAQTSLNYVFDETLPYAPRVEDGWAHLIEPQLSRLVGCQGRNPELRSVEATVLIYLGFLHGLTLIPSGRPSTEKHAQPMLSVSIESWRHHDGTWTP